LNRRLKHSENMLIFGVEWMPVPAFAVDAAGRVIAWNRWMRELTGVEAPEVIGRGDFEYALPFYGERRPILIDFALSSDRKDHEADYVFLRKESFQYVAQTYAPFVRKGPGRRVLCCANPVYDDHRNMIGAVETVEDVSACFTLAGALQGASMREGAWSGHAGSSQPCSGSPVFHDREDAFRHKVQKVQEDERKRIARDLHDTVLQRLGMAKIRLGCVSGNVLQKESAAYATTMVQESIDELRKIIEDLRPAELDLLGISAAVERYCKEFQGNNGGIFVESSIDVDEGKISNDLKIAIYRIAQEALNNIVKHSQADHVKIDLRGGDEGFELVIDDNGVGFDPDSVLAPASGRRNLGLIGMKERAELLGGNFNVCASPGNGARICAKWPQKH